MSPVPCLLSYSLLAEADLVHTLGVPSWLWPALLGALLLIGCGFLLAIVVNVAKLWEIFRAKPAAHDVYATKEEMAALENRLMTSMASNQSNADHWRGEMSGKMDGLQRTFQSFGNELMRALGKLEGRTENLKED